MICVSTSPDSSTLDLPIACCCTFVSKIYYITNLYQPQGTPRCAAPTHLLSSSLLDLVVCHAGLFEKSAEKMAKIELCDGWAL